MIAFRYRKIKFAIDEIENSYLWFSSIKGLDDPFDCNIVQKKNTDVFSAVHTLERFVPDSFPIGTSNQLIGISNYLPEAAQDILRTMSICCFSKRATIGPMWAHYGGDWSGVCIEYDLSNIVTLRDVTYNDVRPIATPSNLTQSKITESLILTKSPEWSYQEELRATRPLKKEGVGAKKEIPRHALRAIHLGPKSDDKARNKLLKLSNKLKIPLYLISLHAEKFSLVNQPWPGPQGKFQN
jgi:hypothetical protein